MSRQNKDRKRVCSGLAKIMRDVYDFDVGPKRNPNVMLRELVANGFVVIDNLKLNNRQAEEVIRQVYEKYKNYYRPPVIISYASIALNIGTKAEVKKRKPNFYDTDEWILLRGKVLVEYGRKCMRCGSGSFIEVDHILPKSKFPEKALDFNNMQVLCSTCNKWKSNTKYNDFRPPKKTGVDSPTP